MTLFFFKFNFMLAEVTATCVGLAFRSYLKPCPQNTLRRHLVAILVGILLGHFFYGRQMWHLFTQAIVTYLAIELCPRKYVHLYVYCF